VPLIRYEFKDPLVNVDKFWSVEHPYKGDPKVFWTGWGRIGSRGQEELSRYKTAEEAKKKLAGKIREKERKGYVLVKGDSTFAQAAATGPGHTAKGLKAGREFSVQLLQTWDGKTVPEHATCESKIDGIRCVFVFSGNRFCAFSRNGNTLNNVMHVAAELYKNFDGYCLDGELIGKGTWEGTMESARSDERGEGSDLFFLVFDCLTHEEIDTRTCRRTLKERLALLDKLWPKKCTMNSGILVGKTVKTPADVERLHDRYVEAGFEGAVLKDLDSCYAFRRTKDWVKIKRFDDADYRVVGTEEGKGKHAGTFGKFMVKGPKGRISGVGSGITDVQRREFWKLGKKLIGKWISVKHQGVSPDGGLRFPVFKRLRWDR
jgi:DNA ligase-1